MLSTNNKDIIYFFKKLGLTDQEAFIFLELNKKGALTVVELARFTKIPRTSVYRLVGSLVRQELVEEIVEEFRNKYQAVGPDQLELLIKEKETHLNYLKNTYPQVVHQLSLNNSEHDPTTKVRFYKGRRGIRKMAWNNLNMKKEGMGYSYRFYEEIIGKEFIHIWLREFAKRGLFFRDIYSDHYVESLESNRNPKVLYDPEHFRSRYIPSKYLNIDIQTDIYNDVVAIYNWYEGEIFGVEIENRKNALFQKQLFEIIWEKASEYKSPIERDQLTS